MKCIICHGEEVSAADVFEEIAVGSNIVRGSLELQDLSHFVEPRSLVSNVLANTFQIAHV